MELTIKWSQNYDLILPVQKVHKQLVWRTKMQCMPYSTSAASHLKCLLPLFVSAYICMCCFYFSAAYVLMCFNFIYVPLCFVLCFYIWFWIAFRIIIVAGGKTASPSSEACFNPGMARNVTVPHAFSSAFSFLLYMIFALFLLFCVLIFF
jgi:predicted histidine transporter YuiF (NhaC family)